MLNGLHGKRMAQHLGLTNSSYLVLKPSTGLNLGLTRLVAPKGLAGPSHRIKPEAAHVLTVHLKRPGLVKNWGMWTGGHFRPVTFWDEGGVDIVDLRSDPIVLRDTAFETVHVYIPHDTLTSYCADEGRSEGLSFEVQTGARDEILLSWVRSLLPFFGNQYLLPTLAMNEMVALFLGYLSKAYNTSSKPVDSPAGGLAVWQMSRANQIIHARMTDDLSLSEIASECGLSPSHFARAFKKSFGIPTHQYLIRKRVERARKLLLHSDLPLLSIALDCGFTDQSAFNRSFRALVGSPPGAWQRQQRSRPLHAHRPNLHENRYAALTAAQV